MHGQRPHAAPAAAALQADPQRKRQRRGTCGKTTETLFLILLLHGAFDLVLLMRGCHLMCPWMSPATLACSSTASAALKAHSDARQRAFRQCACGCEYPRCKRRQRPCDTANRWVIPSMMRRTAAATAGSRASGTSNSSSSWICASSRAGGRPAAEIQRVRYLQEDVSRLNTQFVMMPAPAAVQQEATSPRVSMNFAWVSDSW